jgi:hypothetical protein
MVKAASRRNEEWLDEQTGTMAPNDLCLLFIPRPLYVAMAEEASKRNMTLAQFLSSAVDTYMGVEAQKALPQKEVSNFEFIPAPQEHVPPKNSAKPKLRRFE